MAVSRLDALGAGSVEPLVEAGSAHR